MAGISLESRDHAAWPNRYVGTRLRIALIAFACVSVSAQLVTEGVQAVIDNPVLHQGHTAVFTCKIKPKNNRVYYTLTFWRIFADQFDTIPLRQLSKSGELS